MSIESSSIVMFLNREARFGLVLLPSSASPSWMYGPKRPVLPYTVSPDSGSVPKILSPTFWCRTSSVAFSTVSSSGARSSGMEARSSPIST